jgi:glycerate kinase
MAQASGLTLLEASERNPMLTSTYGTGEMIADALSRGCREFIVGIGGSATNDAGTGMLEALGFRFLDMEGREIKGCCGGRLKDISSIDTSKTQSSLVDARFIIACDVDNPLTGEEGATFTFARQKGADEAAIITLEEGMTSFCSLIRKTTGKDLDLIPGSGAAGGLGGAFIAFTDAELTRGADLILKMTGFDEAIKEADLIITGEGKIDNQTSRGKLPSAVLARSQRTPVVAIGGMVDLTDEEAAATGFEAVLPICPRPITEEDLRKAMDPATAAANIRKTISSYLKKIND